MKSIRKNSLVLSLTGLMLFSSLATGVAHADEIRSAHTAVPESQQNYDQTGSYDSGFSQSPTATTASTCNTDIDHHNPSGEILKDKDVLIIGDSQLWQHESSWSARGISLANYNDTRRIYAAGGIGYMNQTVASCQMNYYEGVVYNRFNLPSGNPSAVLIIGSGNDADSSNSSTPYYSNRGGLENDVRAVIRSLNNRYPHARIVMTDPISAKTAAYGLKVNSLSDSRILWGERLMDIAHEEGATFISTRFWASDYGLSSDPNNYRDNRHFNQTGHDKLAPEFRNSWVQAMRGITLFGGIGQYSANYGGTATFGVPLTNEFSLAGGGSAQQFSHDVSIYWTPAQQAHSVFFKNGIGATYRAGGYENTYGYPQFDEVNISNGAMQKFAKAGHGTTAFYWSKYTDTHKVWERGAIGAKFTNEGGTGKYGFPSDEETAFSYGARQNFYNPVNKKSYRIYWSQNTGAHTMVSGGAIFEKWVSLGHANTLGFPVTDEISESGAVVQYFRNRDGGETGIWWHPTYGTHSMNSKGALYWYWRNHGAYSGLGYPTTDETTYADGSATISFSSGAQLRWTAQSGVQRTK